jgi:hypothetical protein
MAAGCCVMSILVYFSIKKSRKSQLILISNERKCVKSRSDSTREQKITIYVVEKNV